MFRIGWWSTLGTHNGETLDYLRFVGAQTSAVLKMRSQLVYRWYETENTNFQELITAATYYIVVFLKHLYSLSLHIVYFTYLRLNKYQCCLSIYLKRLYSKVGIFILFFYMQSKYYLHTIFTDDSQLWNQNTSKNRYRCIFFFYSC